MSDEATPRSYEPLTLDHLARLSALAERDRQQFYVKQPAFRDRHIATVLAQGSGQHWVDHTNGVKDLDVWSFFALPEGFTRFPADVRKRHVDFGPSELGRQAYDLDNPDLNPPDRTTFKRWSTFTGRRVDLMLRGLPCNLDTDPGEAIRHWLRKGRKPGDGSPWYLAQKGVVLIDPPERRGEIIWPAEPKPNTAVAGRVWKPTWNTPPVFDVGAIFTFMRGNPIPDVSGALADLVTPHLPDLGSEILRGIQSQFSPGGLIPALLSPDIQRAIAQVVAGFPNVVPSNLHEFAAAEWDGLIAIAEEQRIGLAWVPNHEVLQAMLSVDSEAERNAIIDERAEEILTASRTSLHACTDSRLADLADLAASAIATHEDGHHQGAQALATNVLDTAIEQHYSSGVKGMRREANNLKSQGDAITMLEFRLRLATAGLVPAYRDYKYSKRDHRYSRHGTAHAANHALYTPGNSVRAITLAASFLRWLHETWTGADRRP